MTDASLQKIIVAVCFAIGIIVTAQLYEKARRKREKKAENTPRPTSSQADIIASLAEEEAEKIPEMSQQELEQELQRVEAQECCGTHAICEKEQILRALRQQIEYFNDEELDAYQGIAEEDYSDEQVDEFREVLYTMYPSEVEDWLKSLELRGIALPLALKEEACTIIAEQRASRRQ
ncbi:MAG: phospholipase [Bacteroidaceae bacterium]|nr:phospholipase [Bacteroidaceae bacterium]